MPSYYEAKKESKWRNAYLRCFTYGVWFPEHKCRCRVSKKKFKRVLRNFKYWQRRNRLHVWSFGHPMALFFDKQQRCKVIEYLD